MLRVGVEKTFNQSILEDETCLLKIIGHFHAYPGERNLSKECLRPHHLGGYVVVCPIGNKLPLKIIRKDQQFITVERRPDNFGYNINYFSIVGRFKDYVRIGFLGTQYAVTQEYMEAVWKEKSNV